MGALTARREPPGETSGVLLCVSDLCSAAHSCYTGPTSTTKGNGMNVQNRRGGAVHHSTSGTPSCNPWQSAAKFREVKDDVTCKQCIRRGYEEAEETPEAPAVDAEAAPAASAPAGLWAATDTDGRVLHVTRAFSRDDARGRIESATGRDGGYNLARAVCLYSAAHKLRDVRAVTVLDCGPVGEVPACQACADFYERMA